MTKHRKIIVSSISDCREKNGIVTYMRILKSNAEAFHAHEMQLSFVSFVDFPSPRNTPLQAQAQRLSPTPASNPSFGRQTALRMKRAIKARLARWPFGAFLLLLCTLTARGLVTALKSRRHEEPGCIYFYQDVFCAFFGRYLHGNDTHRVLLLHSGNDSLHQVFTHFHGMRGTPYERLVRHQFDRTLESQDAVVTLNEGYARTLRVQFPRLNIRCIYNTSPFEGVHPIPQVAPGLKRLEIVAIGSLQYIKGFDLLIAAVAALSDADRQRLHLTIVGGGVEHVSLQTAINEYNLSDVVTLHGESSDVRPFLIRADAYILTSRDEGFPIALIEACSFGLPIISTKVGSIPEVFDESSCLFTEKDVESIHSALKMLISGAVDLGELSRKSREIFESKLSLNSFLNAYFKLFSEVSAGHAN